MAKQVTLIVCGFAGTIFLYALVVTYGGCLANPRSNAIAPSETPWDAFNRLEKRGYIYKDNSNSFGLNYTTYALPFRAAKIEVEISWTENELHSICFYGKVNSADFDNREIVDEVLRAIGAIENVGTGVGIPRATGTVTTTTGWQISVTEYLTRIKQETSEPQNIMLLVAANDLSK